ncbi:aminotransferase class I/II-fold pyridoxal phosphate-dependent enzyme [Chitinophaga lutea]|uniref:Aminotransferase class I/II-fold pyridoxal phosphate-dependent enzyme n=1 Tax=Chitinophaga lutea TaxID=2488634 RepID=A0A3N4PTK8_9BACT|nr:methionine aminotransferase [Chitinophaga lutea]RPE12163.1 aminotransferase class I/II-fold pyridoxal phosphate-dependent enzyme [Chitinophaga lutea]
MQIASKLPDTGTTIFSVMSALAAQHQAVNLGQGFPDYPMNETLMARVNEAMHAGFNQYAPMQGHLPLREVLAEKVAFLYGTAINPDTQITITPGGTYGIYTALTTVLHPGDEVIVFQPAYDSYIPNIKVNGAVPVLIDLQFPDYKIDWNEVRRKITPRTRMIMINTPHNPTGAVLSAADIEELRATVAGTGIFILSDEVYEHLIYDNIPHQSILRYPDLLERSFVTFSFGKLYHCTGWKLGYCISAPALMQEFRKVHQYNCFSCHTPSQVALAGFLKEKDSYLQLSGFMQAKRDYFANLMSHTRFTPMPSHGSYFQCYQYHRISEEGDADFAVRLTKEFGVATVPVSAFYQSGKDNRVVRFCFAKKEATLETAVERLLKV